MFSFLARTIGLLLLAIALITAVIDITKSIGASEIVITQLGATWAMLSITSIQAAQGAIQGHIHPLLWDPVIQWILWWPTWLVAGILALAFLVLGKRRRKKFGRLASN